MNYSESDLMFTPHMALDVGLALGTYLHKNQNNSENNAKRKKIVIGRDIRTSALPIEYSLISGLISTGCEVKTLGIVTTPTLAMSLKILDADAGCMITASHNTPEYIGLKMWNGNTGTGFTIDQEVEISNIYENKDFIKTEWGDIGRITHINDINETHINYIKNRIQFDGSDLHIIVDTGNGSSCEIVPKLLSSYKINVTTLNANMDGHFPGRYSEPSEENLKQLSRFLKLSKQKDIGMALDGDADRIIFLDENGEIIDPIRLLALLARHYLQNHKNVVQNRNKVVVTAVNASSLLENVLNPLGCEVVRTKIGDIKVANALRKNKGFLAGETSGTYIWPDLGHYGPDSIATIARVIKLMIENGKNLRELLDDIPDYPWYSQSFPLRKDIPFTKTINQDIIDKMRDVFDYLGYELNNINQLDGCRFNYDKGWLLIRRSGTSPYLRISGESTINLEKSIEMNKIAQNKMRKLDLI
jgi:phosphoglucosamine mutase